MKKCMEILKKLKRPQSKPSGVKSLMLQTYLTSLLCLVICVGMFLGTSYAWFTSEVSNSGNEIYIGILDVGMYELQGNTRVDLAATDKPLFDKGIRWEPGYTALETIQVVNEGDLAFNFELNFTDGAVDATGVTLAENAQALPLADIAQYFEVWVCDYTKATAPTAEGQAVTYTMPASFAELKADKAWASVGSLADLLKGNIVLKGDMEPSNQAIPAVEGENATEPNYLADPNARTYVIALHMKDDTSDAQIMGYKIQLNIKLTAYQKGAKNETDSFGYGDDNSAAPGTYDSKLSIASTVATLKETLKKGTDVQLSSNIRIDSIEDCPVMTGGVLYGNHMTITYAGGRNNGNSQPVLTTKGGTIQDLKIAAVEGQYDGRAIFVDGLTDDLHVNNCELSGAYSFVLISAAKIEHSVYFKDTVFNSVVSFDNAVEKMNFQDCTFKSTLSPNGNQTSMPTEIVLVNCKFIGDGNLDVSDLKAGQSIRLTYCEIGGQVIPEAVIVCGENGVAYVDGNNVPLVVDQDSEKVVFTGTQTN